MMTFSNGNIFRVTLYEQKVEQIIETLVIWDAMALIVTSL